MRGTKTKKQLELRATSHFLRAYEKASPSLQGLAEGAIHDFVNRYRADSGKVLHGIDYVSGLRNPVLKIDVSGKGRLLAYYKDDRLILLDFGSREIVSRYSDSRFEREVRKHGEAPEQFWPECRSPFFTSAPDMIMGITYGEEILPEWLYFLEEAQGSVFEEIKFVILESILNDESAPPTFIIGGPGTGKTCVLLNLLKYFTESGCNVGLAMSDELVSYVEASTSADIAQFQVSLTNPPPVDILLLDDPSNSNLKAGLEFAASGRVRILIAAFDPLQLNTALADDEFDAIVTAHQIAVHVLKECYRQKEQVGRATKNVIDVVAKSTPFLAEDKIRTFQARHHRLTEIVNDIKFLNPHGYTKTYENATVEDIGYEVRRILKAKWMMWRHCPGLLVVLNGLELTKPARDALQLLTNISAYYVRSIPLERIKQVKGLEFQHVFIFMKRRLYEEIETGFSGTGRRVYDERRLFRIPFSRAKDSLVTFVIDQPEAD